MKKKESKIWPSIFFKKIIGLKFERKIFINRKYVQVCHGQKKYASLIEELVPTLDDSSLKKGREKKKKLNKTGVNFHAIISFVISLYNFKLISALKQA